MTENLTGMSVFVQVAEARSLSTAARQLGVTPSAVSKTLAKLEGRVGVQLLHRTTRQVNLTEDGRIFFERCKRILSDVRDAELALSQSADAPVGRVNIGTNTTVGRVLLIPALPALLQQYPGITLELSLKDASLEPGRDPVDLVLSWGRRLDSSMVQRKVATFHTRVYASPAYVKKHGAPKSIDVLGNHTLLLAQNQHREGGWRFSVEKREMLVPLAGRVSLASEEALRDLAIEGAGLVQLPEFVCTQAVNKGLLTPVLEPWLGEPRGLFVLYPAAQHHAPRVRAVVEWLVEHFAAMRVSA